MKEVMEYILTQNKTYLSFSSCTFLQGAVVVAVVPVAHWHDSRRPADGQTCYCYHSPRRRTWRYQLYQLFPVDDICRLNATCCYFTTIKSRLLHVLSTLASLYEQSCKFVTIQRINHAISNIIYTKPPPIYVFRDKQVFSISVSVASTTAEDEIFLPRGETCDISSLSSHNISIERVNHCANVQFVQ